MSLLGAWREYRRFRRLPPEHRNIVFYSESRHDWHHFRPIIERLTGEWRRVVCHVTSDDGDDVLDGGNERLLEFRIGRGMLRIVFFQFLRADLMVLTMMDLDNLELRRSVHPVHYAYVFHSLGSTHMTDLENSFDHYDTIFCAGPHHVREIRRREEQKGLAPKRLVEHGYARLEALITARALRAEKPESDSPILLLAPTWGDSSILNVCGERLVGILLDAGYRVILRPHYQTLLLTPGVVEGILQRFGAHPRLEYVNLLGETESLYRSDLLICDWSAMAVEYALGLEKPVLFVDVPRRVRNPNYLELGLEPIEARIREEIGAIIDPARLEEAPARIEQLLTAPDRFRERAARLRQSWVFNIGRSSEVAARELVRIADEKAAERVKRSHAR